MITLAALFTVISIMVFTLSKSLESTDEIRTAERYKALMRSLGKDDSANTVLITDETWGADKIRRIIRLRAACTYSSLIMLFNNSNDFSILVEKKKSYALSIE